MSESVEPFTLCPFGDEPECAAETGEFVGIFDTSTGEFDAEEEQQEESGEIVDEPIDVEAATRKIFEEAFAEGEKAGREMGMKRVDPLVKRLNRYISELEQAKDDLRERSETMCIELAFVFAEAIVLQSCDEKREIVSEMVKKALDICEGSADVTIRVRPDDVQYVTARQNAFLKIVPDDSVQEPGFVIETNFGDIDGRISTQLEELKKRILE